MIAIWLCRNSDVLQQSDQAIWIQRRSLSAVHVCPGTTTACAHSAGPILDQIPEQIFPAQSPKWAVNKHLKSYNIQEKCGQKGQKLKQFLLLHSIASKSLNLFRSQFVSNMFKLSSALEVGRKKVTCFIIVHFFFSDIPVSQFHGFTFTFTFIFSRRKYALFPSESLRLRTRCNHTRRTLATSYLTNQAFLCAFFPGKTL